MKLRKIATSSLVIGAALMSAQGWAQQAATPAEPATSVPAEPATVPPASGTSATPAQPGTTPVPASEPAATTAQPAPAPSDPVTQPAPSGQAETTPAPAAPTEPAPAQQAQAAPASGTTQVAAFVDQQFPQADADGDGSLSATEFQPWISKLKSAELQSAGKPADAAEVQTYAANAFASADKDSNKLVTKAELTQFLGQG